MKPRYPEEWLEKVPAEVFACMHPGELRVVLLPGNGQLNGGAHLDGPIDLIPAELRMPNTHIWLQLNADMKILRAWRRDD